MVALLPTWLLGCGVYDAYQWLRRRQLTARVLHAGFAVAGVVGYSVVRLLQGPLTGLSRMVSHFTAMHGHPTNVRVIYLYWGTGLWAAFFALWVLLLADRFTVRESSRWVRGIRTASEANFPLYLFHLPLFVLIRSLLAYNPANAAFKVGMLGVAVGLSLLLIGPTNRLKIWLRERLRSRVRRRAMAAEVAVAPL